MEEKLQAPSKQFTYLLLIIGKLEIMGYDNLAIIIISYNRPILLYQSDNDNISCIQHPIHC